MPKLLTYQEAADELNVSVGWLKKKVASRAIPFRRLGDLVRFSEADLEAIADQAAFAPPQPRARGRR